MGAVPNGRDQKGASQEGGKTFDPHAPLVAQNGLEYENFAAYLQGKPAQTMRNGNIQSYRLYDYAEECVQAYASVFDKKADEQLVGPSPKFGRAHLAGIDAAVRTGVFGPGRYQTARPPA